MRMISMTSMVLTAALLGVVAVNAQQGKASRVLVHLTFAGPPDVKTGDEVTTLLRFMATQDVEQLDASVREGSGLAILSQPYDVVFSDLRKGMVREFEVRIRVTGENRGRLVVSYSTRSATYGTARESKVIEYGATR